MKGRELFHARKVPQPSLRREDLMARTLAAEYEKLFKSLRLPAQIGPYAVLNRLQELVGDRGVDAARLRQRLNAQLIAETRRVVSDLVENGSTDLRLRLGSLSIPHQEAFGQKIQYIRELYLDDAVARIQGEEDDLKAAFLSRLTAWAEGEAEEIDVADIVEKMKETADGRARFFARDQFSRFNRSVAVASYQQAEAEYVEWITSNDVRVRDTHKERNHRIYTMQELLADPEWKSYNCILPGAKIEGSIIAGSKAWYSGGVKVIVTARGSELSVTPNHPVLTLRGWMPARLVQKGDRLFRHEIDAERYASLGRSPDEEYAPTSIEDVFGALCPKGSVECRAAYFHGDGERIEGQINVVTAAGLLRNDRVAGSSEPVDQKSLESSFLPIWSEPGSLSPDRSAGKSRLVGVGPFGRIPGGSTLTLDQPSVVSHQTPFQPFRFGSVSRLYARADQSAKDRGAVDSELVGQLFAARSFGIEMDEIVDIKESSFSGHVYDLQSLTGWIIAEKLLVGNCRCGFAPLWKLTAEQERRRVA
jgi:hypothetical protein